LTEQGTDVIPQPLKEAVQASGGRIWVLPSDACLHDKAVCLRTLANNKADLVVVNQAPHDVVPIVAFAKLGGPPVVCVNDNDHHFWLGPTIADIVIDLRCVVPNMSKNRRYARATAFLPIPLCAPLHHLSRFHAREILGIPKDQVVLLSIGRSAKYIPSPKHNFYATSNKILNENPNAHIYLVGVSENEHIMYSGYVTHPRLHFVGPIGDPSFFQAAADIYLEGFPFGSQTALLESCLNAIPPVLAFAPSSSLLVTNDISLEGLVSSPIDEQAYIDKVSYLIANSEIRKSLGVAIADSILSHHVGSKWLSYLEALYTRTDDMVHAPNIIPHAPRLTTDDDLAVASLGLIIGQKYTDKTLSDYCKNISYILHKQQYYRSAVGTLCYSAELAGWDRYVLIALIKIIARWILSGLFNGRKRSSNCTISPLDC
jgi:hypothetical protein